MGWYDKYTICKKCGKVSDEYFARNSEYGQNVCVKCKGEMITIDLTQEEAEEKYKDEIKDAETISEQMYIIEEIIRKEYYYGKLDQEKDISAFKKREQDHEDFVSGKLYAECKEIERKRDTNTFAPKCPSCGSTNLSKITATRKILKVGLFGRLGTGDLGKTYKCGDCGVKF